MPHAAGATAVTWILVVVKTLILLMGGVITYFAYKAYRRTRDRSLGLLAVGFALITLGAMLGGVANELLQTTLTIGVIVEGIFALAGFTMIALSLRVSR